MCSARSRARAPTRCYPIRFPKYKVYSRCYAGRRQDKRWNLRGVGHRVGVRPRTLSSVSAAKVARYFAERRESGLSVESCNHDLTAFKAFCNWMVRERLATENPLAHVSKLQVTENARRHVRRWLAPQGRASQCAAMRGADRSSTRATSAQSPHGKGIAAHRSALT